jgi:hypothetical protein
MQRVNARYCWRRYEWLSRAERPFFRNCLPGGDLWDGGGIGEPSEKPARAGTQAFRDGQALSRACTEPAFHKTGVLISRPSNDCKAICQSLHGIPPKPMGRQDCQGVRSPHRPQPYPARFHTVSFPREGCFGPVIRRTNPTSSDSFSL